MSVIENYMLKWHPLYIETSFVVLPKIYLDIDHCVFTLLGTFDERNKYNGWQLHVKLADMPS